MKRRRRRLAAVGSFILLGLPLLLRADDAGGPAGNLGASALKALGALLLVLAVVVVLAWLARRYLHLPTAGLAKGNQIQILSFRALGPRRSLYLLEVEGRRLLIGSSDSGVTLLKDLSTGT